MAETADCIVIGAGVVGLAIARELAIGGREVIVLEAESAIGTATSSRNSGVIHAGIPYPGGSLKARLCIRGKELLYRYCPEHGVGHRRLGKLIVAVEESEVEKLHALKEKAAANAMHELEFLDQARAQAMEPALRCVAALSSPTTGIIDVHDLMLAFQGDAEDAGAAIAFNSPVTGGRAGASGIELRIGGASPVTVACKALINSAGLEAQSVASRIEGLPRQTIPERFLAKGSYFVLAGKAPFARLIYPLPGRFGLGVHLTLDMGGRTHFGPDVEWVDEIDYDVNEGRAEEFYAAVRRFWPGLENGALKPGYAGIRPKLARTGSSDADFVIQGEKQHGVPGLVNLYGIESPGLTAAMAIAEEVAAIVARGQTAAF